jgi:hypothetical protein
MSVVERTGLLRSFALKCSRTGGITATADFGTPSPHAFAGAERVDLALAHDGTDLVGYARDHNVGGPWFEISRTALAAAGTLFLPELRAQDFAPGQMISFYSLRIRANAPYGPGQVSPAHEAVRSMGEAMNSIADGADALMSGMGGLPAAMADLDAAAQSAQAAVASLDAAAAAAGKKPSRAARSLKKARKGAAKAAKKFSQALGSLDTGGTPDAGAIVKKVGAAALGIAKAADLVLPDDLRAAIGGRTLSDYVGK